MSGGGVHNSEELRTHLFYIYIASEQSCKSVKVLRKLFFSFFFNKTVDTEHHFKPVSSILCPLTEF